MTDPIRHKCPDCQTLLEIPREKAGTTVACPKCQRPVPIPAAESTATPLLLQLAIQYGFLEKKEAARIMAAWQTVRIQKPDTDILRVMERHPHLTPERLQTLKAARIIWKQRQQDQKFGALAVKLGYTTKETIAAALAQQSRLLKSSGKAPLIGDLLVASSAISLQQQQQLMAMQSRRSHTPQPDLPDTETTTAQKNDADPETVVASDSELRILPPPEEDATGFAASLEISVTKDHMAAFIREISPLPEDADVTTLIDYIRQQGITFGLVDASLLDGFLKFKKVRQSRFKVAEGIVPETGTDGSVTYHFDTDFLTIGAVQGEEGKIDFRDRGKIPHVTQGALLAERIPAIHGRNGTDVFDTLLTVPHVRDPQLKAAAGTYAAADGLSVFAKMEGQPGVSLSGHVSVLEEFTINGDVGYETGHVDFDGNVRITGTVKNGFHVRAAHVIVAEVDGGSIFATGDVTVNGGLSDATIQAEGNVRARFVNQSKIRAFGNITVAGELIDSDVACSGGCDLRTGKIIHSEVAAKQGIEVRQVGTDVSPPSRLTVGVDQQLEEALTAIEEKIQNAHALVAGARESRAALDETEKEIHQAISANAQIQDRSGLRIRQIQQEDFEAAQIQPHEAADCITELKAAVKEAEAALEALFEQQDRLIDDKILADQAISEAQTPLQDLLHEKSALEDWGRDRTPIPLIRVGGTIHGGNHVIGPNTRATLKQSSTRVMIREYQIRDAEGQLQHVMRVIR